MCSAGKISCSASGASYSLVRLLTSAWNEVEHAKLSRLPLVWIYVYKVSLLCVLDDHRTTRSPPYPSFSTFINVCLSRVLLAYDRTRCRHLVQGSDQGQSWCVIRMILLALFASCLTGYFPVLITGVSPKSMGTETVRVMAPYAKTIIVASRSITRYVKILFSDPSSQLTTCMPP